MGRSASSNGERGPLGPRGGTSQRTESMIRKNVWLPKELCEALRAKAFQERRAEADIVRAALAAYLRDGGEEEGST